MASAPTEPLIEGLRPGQPRPDMTRRVLLWLGGLFAALVLAMAGVLLGLNTQVGKRFIADEIAQLSPENGLKISVGRIEGNIYGEAVIRDLSLADPQGTFLTIPEATLDWRPFSFARDRLDIRELRAERGQLLRLPELEPGDPDSPILPGFDIRIDALDLRDFRLAPGLAGAEARRLNLTGRADIRDGRAMIEADGRLGEGDRIVVELIAEPDGDVFDADVRIDAPAKGVITSLANLEGAYSARLDGEGTWTEWAGDLRVNHNGGRIAQFSLTNQSGQYAIEGRADTRPVLQGILARAFGQATQLQATGTFIDRVLDGRVRVRGEGLDISAQGAADLANNAARRVQWNARLLDPELFAATATFEDASAEGTIDGAFRDLAIPFSLSVGRFSAGSAEIANIEQEGTATYDGSRWILPINASIGRIETGNELADPRLVGGTLAGRLVYSGRRLVSDAVRITFPDASAQLTIQGDIPANRWQVRGPAAVNGLFFEQVGTVNAGGAIDFLFDDGWQLEAQLDGQVPRVTNDTLRNIAGPQIDFRGGVSLGEDRPIDFRGVRLTSRSLTMAVDGRVEPGTTSIAGRGRQADYGDFTVEAALQDDGPRATLVFAEPVPAAGLRDVRVAVSPIDEGFRIETDGQSMLGQFNGVLGLFAPPDGPTRIAIDELTVWETQVTGDVTLGEGAATGRLDLTQGGVEGAIRLAPEAGGQSFAVNLTARNARFGGETALSIISADIDASGLVAGGDTTIRGEANARGMTYGNFFIGRATANAELTNGTGKVTAAAAGRRGRGFALQLDANVAPERIAVAARGNFSGQEMRMPRRAVITLAEDGGWAFAPTQVNFGEGFLRAEGQIGGTTTLDLRFADLPLSVADIAIGDAGLGGTISGSVEYSAPDNQGLPTANARVSVKRFTRSGVILASRPIDLSLVGRLTETKLEARAILKDDGEQDGRIQALISDLPSDGDLYSRLQRGNLVGQMRYRGAAQSLWRLAAIDLFDFSGPISIAADMRGTLADPRVRGSLASDELRVQSGLSGTDIRNARVRGDFAGSRLRIQSFRGTAINGGAVSGSGVVDLAGIAPGRGPEIDLRIATRNAELIDARGLVANVTGPLRIVSNGSGGTIAGRLQINQASWRLGIADEVVEIPNIPVREQNIPVDRVATSRPSSPWRYLIDARAPSRVDVDGLGLESEWSANVRVRGTTDDLRIGGEANLVRGDYTFAGTRFEVTRGRIEFDESVPIDPRVNIRAESARDGTSVIVNITGNAQSPEINFSSDPALPEEEILSRLLFGGSVTNLSATDALQLTAAVASLRGGGGLDPINQLRTAIGLDRLRLVGPDPVIGRGTAVAIGKNIGRRFYVELITDGQGYSATEAEFRITSWLALLGSVSTIGRNSAVVEVSRDY